MATSAVLRRDDGFDGVPEGRGRKGGVVESKREEVELTGTSTRQAVENQNKPKQNKTRKDWASCLLGDQGREWSPQPPWQLAQRQPPLLCGCIEGDQICVPKPCTLA